MNSLNGHKIGEKRNAILEDRIMEVRYGGPIGIEFTGRKLNFARRKLFPEVNSDEEIVKIMNQVSPYLMLEELEYDIATRDESNVEFIGYPCKTINGGFPKPLKRKEYGYENSGRLSAFGIDNTLIEYFFFDFETLKGPSHIYNVNWRI